MANRIAPGPPTVCLTVDMEQDCPPYLDGFRGITGATGPLLALLAHHQVSATFFTTGQVARTFPDLVGRIVAAGHELGSHGDTHRSFATMDRPTARRQIRAASRTLRNVAPVTSFRAPYLSLPEAHLDLLVEDGFSVDASLAKYKLAYLSARHPGPIQRAAASATSSVLRLPPWLRDRWLALLSSPVVLFVHPWEFIDLTRTRLRPDCRFATGLTALNALGAVLAFFHRRGAVFKTIGACYGQSPPEPNALAT